MQSQTWSKSRPKSSTDELRKLINVSGSKKPGMDHQIVVFGIAQEHFGVAIAMVESIIKMQPITKMLCEMGHHAGSQPGAI
jgi:chemotaxis signal transduction protein